MASEEQALEPLVGLVRSRRHLGFFGVVFDELMGPIGMAKGDNSPGGEGPLGQSASDSTASVGRAESQEACPQQPKSFAKS